MLRGSRGSWGVGGWGSGDVCGDEIRISSAATMRNAVGVYGANPINAPHQDHHCAHIPHAMNALCTPARRYASASGWNIYIHTCARGIWEPRERGGARRALDGVYSRGRKWG